MAALTTEPNIEPGSLNFEEEKTTEHFASDVCFLDRELTGHPSPVEWFEQSKYDRWEFRYFELGSRHPYPLDLFEAREEHNILFYGLRFETESRQNIHIALSPLREERTPLNI